MQYIPSDKEQDRFVDDQLAIVFLCLQRIYHRTHREVAVIHPNKELTNLVIQGTPGIAGSIQHGMNSKTLQKNVLKAVDDWKQDPRVFERIGI